jgi:hypothetical protein
MEVERVGVGLGIVTDNGDVSKYMYIIFVSLE